KEIDPKLAELGRRTVKAFGVTGRFVHMEFFKLDRVHKGLGEEGDYVGLEVNMRPAGGYTPDMMNYAHNTDVFAIWADMVAFDECRTGQGEQTFCAYAGRRDIHTYKHSHEDVLKRFEGHFRMVQRMPEALSSALCDMAYLAVFNTREEMKDFFAYIGE
ncbi:MAG: carbamoylphosphate synthase large subunit, partial [Bacteroidales bacterium]|nr:carbamoylphosphate synthase large subunit [Bacteroidales bacterium]